MSAVLPATRMTTPWRQALPALGVVLVTILLLFRDTFAGMVEIWSRSDTFAHAFLVPPIVLWLVWRHREYLAPITPRPQPWMLLPMALAGAGWLVGDLASVNALEQLMVTALLVLAVPAVLGLTVARALLFPLAFLFFMVPIGEFLLPVLMEATADFTVLALRLTGVPVFREGLQFVIPTGYWSVVEACSGVRYLIASFMVGSLFGYLNYQTPWRRWVFAGVSIVVPILANWMRAYIIVMLGHLSNNRIATGVDHLVYGWVFFGVVILLMFFIGARWSEPDAPKPARAAVLPGAVAASPAATWAVTALALAAVAWPGFAQQRIELQVLTGTPRLALPATLPGGQVLEPTPAGSYQPVYVGAAAEADGVYRAGEQTVGLHVAYYRAQGPGRKLISSDNTLVRSNDHKYNQTSLRIGAVDVAGQRIEFRQAEVLIGGLGVGPERQRLEVRQLYRVGGRWLSRPEWVALHGAMGRMAGDGDDAAAVVLYASGDDAAATARQLDAFLQQQLPQLEAMLAAARRPAP